MTEPTVTKNSDGRRRPTISPVTVPSAVVWKWRVGSTYGELMIGLSMTAGMTPSLSPGAATGGPQNPEGQSSPVRGEPTKSRRGTRGVTRLNHPLPTTALLRSAKAHAVCSGGAGGGIRTPTPPKGQRSLSPPRLPFRHTGPVPDDILGSRGRVLGDVGRQLPDDLGFAGGNLRAFGLTGGELGFLALMAHLQLFRCLATGLALRHPTPDLAQ